MKRSVKKHSKRCNGKLKLIRRTYTYGLSQCNKCSFKSRSFKRRKVSD